MPGLPGSYAQIPVPVVDTTQSFTVAAWVQLQRLNGYQTFVSEDGDVLSAFFLQLRADTRQFSFTVPYDFFVLPQSGFTPEVGRWYHLAGVNDAVARSASLYVDGVLADTVYSVVSLPATGPTGIDRGKFAGNPVDLPAGARVGVANDGFWGDPGPATRALPGLLLRQGRGGLRRAADAEPESGDGATVYARARGPRLTADWKQYTVLLETDRVPTTADARLVVSTRDAGTFWLTQVSLFPRTYRDRPNGNRVDLMRMMAGLRPAFLRLPGGNFLEGNTIADRFEWKDTIGPLAVRPGHQGPWGYASIEGRPTPDLAAALGDAAWLIGLERNSDLVVMVAYAPLLVNVNPGGQPVAEQPDRLRRAARLIRARPGGAPRAPPRAGRRSPRDAEPVHGRRGELLAGLEGGGGEVGVVG